MRKLRTLVSSREPVLPLVTGFSTWSHTQLTLSPCTPALSPGGASLPPGGCLVLQASRAALASEEPRVARLQAQLKELVAFPDLQPLCDSVVVAIQEYKRYRRMGAVGLRNWGH